MKLAFLLAVLVCRQAAAFVIDDGDPGLTEFVNRIKRHDEVHGHSVGVLHAEDPETGQVHRLTKRDVLNHIFHPSPANRRFSLQLQNGDNLELALARINVVTSDTKVVEWKNDGTEVMHDVPLHCYFAGTREDLEGRAVLSLCGGKPMGAVMSDKRHYEIIGFPSEVEARHRRSSDEVHVLVTWSDVTQSHDPEHASLRPRRSADDDEEEYGSDGIEIPNDDDDDDDTPTAERRRRSTEGVDPSSRKLMIESVAFVDEDFTGLLANKYDLSDIYDFVHVAVLKFSGMYAVYSDPKTTWDIAFKLVHVEIWNKNPSWYMNETEKLSVGMGGRLWRVCNDTKNRTDLDLVVLWTANIPDNGRAGLSYIGGVCRPKFRCNVQMGASLKFRLELHETGHSLGLPHEGDMSECHNSTERSGFMGGGAAYFPTCYGVKLNKTLQKKRCLLEDTSPAGSGLPIQRFSPGQIVGLDGQCKFAFGNDFEYMHSEDANICDKLYCRKRIPGIDMYYEVRSVDSVSGTPCGRNMMCSFSMCLPLNETSYGATLQDRSIVDGRWSPFTRFSPCNVPTNDSGLVPLQIARRTCDRVVPDKGTYCEGSAFRVRMCKTGQESGEFDGLATSSRVCSFHRDAGANTSYDGVGRIAAFRGAVRTCTAECRTTNNKFSTVSYTLPNGSPCAAPDSAVDDDFKGIRRYCVDGVCLGFGCNDKQLGRWSHINDVCGVCGGRSSAINDACTYGEMRNLTKGERQTLVMLPAGATNIYIGHSFRDQTDVNIEMWTKDVENNQAVMSRDMRVAFRDMDANTALNYAHTDWYLDKTLQTLKATGPLVMPVNITLYKTDTKPFELAFYRYAMDQHQKMTSLVCQNGGTYMPDLGGCSCAKGFYGITCDTTCPTLCQHGAPVNAATCQCECNERQHGDTCQCVVPYSGLHCAKCGLKRCQNRGTLDKTSCSCSCLVNCDGIDCGEQCQDTRAICSQPHRCTTHALYREECRKSCGLCQYNGEVNGGQCARN